MEIERASREFSPNELYAYTGDNAKCTLFKNAPDSTYVIVDFIAYSKVNAKGEKINMLSLITDNGEVLSGQSSTVKKALYEILDFEVEFPITVKFEDGLTNSGREFINMRYIP